MHELSVRYCRLWLDPYASSVAEVHAVPLQTINLFKTSLSGLAALLCSIQTTFCVKRKLCAY